ncbi:MAG: hypothetical protein M1834_004959 [Cirrosporium novae-zelandiae]|nr:MAG: hypothetical protein M1834_004959 [Cirrosporium novae-zelandiae]
MVSPSSTLAADAQKYNLQPSEIETLAQKAIEAQSTAYCPYSNFHVGACILTDEGEYIAGANVENASFPVGSCAEQVAFGMAVGAPSRRNVRL